MNKAGENTLFLVDGSGFIFRAYHALPPMTNPQGVPVNAVLGFVNMMVKLLKDMDAPLISVIFDAKGPTFRNEIYGAYKANRDAPPEDLVPQFPLFRDATRAFGIEPLEMQGYEADDLIATYARLAKEHGYDVVIVSSDKDLMQLIEDGVRLFDPMKGGWQEGEAVMKKFGVTADKVIDVQALAGDSIDNIPGIPGIGVKTAAQLINDYGDLDTLLARAEEIKQPKRRESLIEHAEAARLSRQLVTLDKHVAVPMAIDQLKARDLDSPDLNAFLNQHGFRSVQKRLGAPIDDSPHKQDDTPSPAVEIKGEYTLINNINTLNDYIEKIKLSGCVAIDTETTHLTPSKADLVGISLSCEPGKAVYIPLGHVAGEVDLLGENRGDDIPQIPMTQCLKALQPVLEDPAILKIAHNMKYDWQIIAAHGVEMHPIEDTMILSYTLQGTRASNSLDELSLTHFNHQNIKFDAVAGKGKARVSFDRVPIEKALNYAAEDADMTYRLWSLLKPQLAQQKMSSLYERIERPLVPIIAKMEQAGILVDPATLRTLSNDFAQRLQKLETKIHAQAEGPFNIASPKQVGQVLFGQLGLQGGKKTKTGDWSTSADILEKLAAQSVEDGGHAIVQDILDWRQLAKLRSTYTEALQEQINQRTQRVHTSYSLAATSTGRLASSDPNLQNIPIRTEAGRSIRSAFIAPEGKMLISADYSQIELRLISVMANIPALKDAFIAGQDIHARTASEIFDTPLTEVTAELRRNAKAINFGIIYGISAFGLAKNLNIPASEASAYIKNYFKRFPELADYMEAIKAEARDKNYVETEYGRKCWIRGINDKNGMVRSGAERQAINAPVQGTAADIIKKAMIVIDQEIRAGRLDAQLLLQVHDELIFEVDQNKAEAVAQQICTLMQNVANFEVPLIAEAGCAKSWAEAH